MSTQNKRRAAIYCRVSSSGNRALLGDQETRCRQYAAERGYTVVVVYRNVATTDPEADHLGLDQLRLAVQRGDVDVLLCPWSEEVRGETKAAVLYEACYLIVDDTD